MLAAADNKDRPSTFLNQNHDEDIIVEDGEVVVDSRSLYDMSKSTKDFLCILT